ncbi:MAG: class A beta-lactamase-related serine hydrolase [Alphaproteobacteria bacterium]|nr:MAG: class A beta-lactamase-related serine hydrolase [Alphaproteobacteria bacterium]
MRHFLAALTITIGLAGPAMAAETEPAVAEQAPLAEAEAIAALEIFVDDMAGRDEFSGTILVTRGGERLYGAAFGLASKRFDVPASLETRFNLGSVNKMFTAIGILQLAEAGKLHLGDRLGQYLDESWLPHDVTDRIELRHLLTHASGLGSYFSDAFFAASKTRFRTVDDFKPLIAGDRPEFEPGTGYRYSNTGMLLLGAVIEKVSGQSYDDYIRDHILAPAGMKLTGCFAMDDAVKNVAIGYDANKDTESGWQTNLFFHSIKGGPAGGCFSTVGDLQLFAAALTANRYLSPEGTASLFVPRTEFHTEPYGYGFKIKGTAGHRIVGHTGGFMGISASLDIFLDDDYVVAVLSNYGGAAHQVAEKARDLLMRVPTP